MGDHFNLIFIKIPETIWEICLKLILFMKLASGTLLFKNETHPLIGFLAVHWCVWLQIYRKNPNLDSSNKYDSKEWKKNKECFYDFLRVGTHTKL